MKLVFSFVSKNLFQHPVKCPMWHLKNFFSRTKKGLYMSSNRRKRLVLLWVAEPLHMNRRHRGRNGAFFRNTDILAYSIMFFPPQRSMVLLLHRIASDEGNDPVAVETLDNSWCRDYMGSISAKLRPVLSCLGIVLRQILWRQNLQACSRQAQNNIAWEACQILKAVLPRNVKIKLIIAF